MRLVPIVLAVGCGKDKDPVPPDPDGQISEPAAISLTLKDPDSTSGTNAAFVAVRDGDGDWTEVTGSNGVYTARVTSNRYGWWVGCVRASGTGRNSIIYRHLDDGVDFERSSCVPRTLPLTISGALTGVPETDSAEVYSLSSFAFPIDGTYSVGTAAGPAQVLASRIDENFNGVSVIRADLGTLAADATRDLDFAQDAQPYLRLPLAVTGRQSGDLVETLAGVYVGEGAMYFPFESARESAELLALPAAMVQPGDMFDTTVIVKLATGTLTDQRTVSVLASTVPQSLTLPAPKSFGDATVTQSPFSIGWTLPSLDAEATVSAFWIATSRTNRLVLNSISTTPKWNAGSTTVDVTELGTLPDALTQLPNVSFGWSIEAITGDFFAGGYASSGTQGDFAGTSARAPSRRELRSLHEARISSRR